MSEQSSTSGGSRGRGGRSSGASSSSSAPAGDDAPAKAEAAPEGSTPATDEGTPVPETHDEQGKPTPAPAAEQGPEGELHWYRAVSAMGEGDTKVRAGQKFQAYADDVRVKSGMVTKLGPVVPDNVAEAFAKLEGGLAGGLGSTSS